MLGRALHSALADGNEVFCTGSRDLDITSAEACSRVIAAARPEIVVNAAAYTNVDGCETRQNECFSVNAQGVKNIALACRDLSITVVHFSTDYVFDGKKGSPYSETDACTPLNVYGRSKLEGERLLEATTRDFLLIRTSWLYGRYGKNFVGTILDKAGSAGRLEVVTDQIGSPTNAEDLAAATATLIRDGQAGIFHVANSGQCSWYDFTLEILRCRGLTSVTVLPITSDRLARPALRPPYSVLDCSKFRAATGGSLRPWQDAVRDFLSPPHEEPANTRWRET